MKINITKKEYTVLLEILQMAVWVLQAHRSDEPEDRKKYMDFEQKILGFAKDYGCDHWVQFDRKSGKFFPTKEFEETSPGMGFIEEFEDEFFWEELVDRLTTRDVFREVSEAEYAKLELLERFRKREPFEVKYWKEFETHGLERLAIAALKMEGYGSNSPG